MKQFIAFAAILAVSAFAQEDDAEEQKQERPFALNVSYANEDEMFLGLEMNNAVTLRLPKARAPRGSGIECSGWQLAQEDANGALVLFDWDAAEFGQALYTDFYIEKNESGQGRRKKSSLVLTAD